MEPKDSKEPKNSVLIPLSLFEADLIARLREVEFGTIEIFINQKNPERVVVSRSDKLTAENGLIFAARQQVLIAKRVKSK